MSTKGVPFTATSTTALFGSRNLNGVQDIRITNKTTNYVNDGCGRDNYIKFPNGGFRHTWENNYRNSYTRPPGSGPFRSGPLPRRTVWGPSRIRQSLL